MRITHVVCTSNFAGVERHIAVLAAAQAERGHEVTVLGGDLERMREAIGDDRVRLRAVSNVADAVRLLSGGPGTQADIVATNMTAADLAAAGTPALRRTPIVSTRHFAARRGSSPSARAAVRATSRRLTTNIAVSQYVADTIGEPSVVVHPGIADRSSTSDASARSRTVLVVQRLEPDKSTATALLAFHLSGLGQHGWRLQIAGEGAERAALEALADELGIAPDTDFLGYRTDIDELMTKAGLLIATTRTEAMGLSVLEAMASGLPVVATASGGHLESVGPVPGAALYPPDEPREAAFHLTDLARDPVRRSAYGRALQDRQRQAFAVESQVEATDRVYRHALATLSGAPVERADGRDLVVVSLEPWDKVWRRNQYLVEGLLRRDPNLRVLFVEPAADPVHALRIGGSPSRGAGLRRGPLLPGVSPDALWLHQPTKWLPRRVDRDLDRRWARQVRIAAARLGMSDPLLWVNDPVGAELLELTGWPALYDITDDWLEADRDAATHDRLARQEESLMRHAEEVVVCSTGLERVKSARRPVTLLRNAVDLVHTRTPVPRPMDLPPGPVAVYVGTLHSDRLDVELCCTSARALAPGATLVLVGPDALTTREQTLLDRAGVVRLGAKDHRSVPGYLQHADVLVVPHVVDEFTDSLDPIKLYEYAAVARPVVSTPVSGFREAAGGLVHVSDAGDFPSVLARVLAAPPVATAAAAVPTWDDRVGEMSAVLDRVEGTESSSAGQVTTTIVPEEARVRLCHAAVQWLADEHHIDVLHIKGYAIDPRLSQSGRTSSDVDVLVRPRQVDDFLRVALDAGFEVLGRFATSSPFEHSATLVHPDFGFLDVHRLYPGTGPDPTTAFDRLWAKRTHRLIAGRSCPTPEPAAQVVVLVLHAARGIPDGQADRDVTHAWRDADTDLRARVRQVVADLDAEVAFAAGTGTLDTLPMSPERALWSAVSHPDARVDEWRARIAAAPNVASRLRLLLRIPLVNTDHLAMNLGRRPTRREVGRAFLDRTVRGAREIARRGRRR